MRKILDAVEEFLKEDEWPYRPLEDRTVLQAGFRGQNGEWTCYARARDEQSQLIFYSVCPFRCEAERRAAAAEFLIRANYGLLLGAFEMDYSDGEIRYRTGISLEGIKLNTVVIKTLLYENVLMMDRYLPGITWVVQTDVSPDDALASVEG